MQEEIEALRNEIAKRNRDQLDMMYNLDMDNFSEDAQALFKKWSNGSEEAIAYFNTYISENEAKWESYASWKTSTSNSIASISGRVSANESSINSIASWKSNTADAAISSISAIEQKANKNEASISTIVAWKQNTADSAISSISSIQQQANENGARIGLLVNSSGTGLETSAASVIVDAINNAESSVKISADHIILEGETSFITAADLSDSGSTEVSGNRINLITQWESTNPSSSLDFKIELPSGRRYYMGYIEGGDLGSGELNDARLQFRMVTQSFTYDGETYYPAIYIKSAGGVAIHSRGDPSGIYVRSYYSYITFDASENTRIRANSTYLSMGNTGPMEHAPNDYVFCSDGIYYNGVLILSTS